MSYSSENFEIPFDVFGTIEKQTGFRPPEEIEADDPANTWQYSLALSGFDSLVVDNSARLTQTGDLLVLSVTTDGKTTQTIIPQITNNQTIEEQLQPHLLPHIDSRHIIFYRLRNNF